MGHRLPRVLPLVDDEAIPLRKPELRRELPDLFERPPQERGAGVVRLRKAGEVLARDAQKVDVRLGLDVLEDDDLPVLIHFGGGDLPRQDLTEYAVFHVDVPPYNSFPSTAW